MARFDMIMGESRGWIHISTPMSNVNPKATHHKVIVVIQELPSSCKISPFKSFPSEILPLGVERNFNGFLVKTHARSVTIDGDKLKDRIKTLKGELLIGKFVEPQPSQLAFKAWLQALNQ